jgi:hypothetical protein
MVTIGQCEAEDMNYSARHYKNGNSAFGSKVRMERGWSLIVPVCLLREMIEQ